MMPAPVTREEMIDALRAYGAAVHGSMGRFGPELWPEVAAVLNRMGSAGYVDPAVVATADGPVPFRPAEFYAIGNSGVAMELHTLNLRLDAVEAEISAMRERLPRPAGVRPAVEPAGHAGRDCRCPGCAP